MKGQRTRAGILDRAVDLASLEGLEGVSIGRLADELSMSKSGLFAHFGSKEELQLATVEAARERFVEEVVRPALKRARGFERLEGLCHSWIAYVERRVFPGGCFFAAASFEFDGRDGPVRAAIVGAMNEWIATLDKAVRMAKEAGHVDADADPAQVAFELNALFFGANFAWNLVGDERAFEHARRAINQRLQSLRPSSPPAPPARRAARAPRRRGQPARGTRRRSSSRSRS
jgi:AcrR family transcriptional regulator